jgi:hypothetical protein
MNTSIRRVFVMSSLTLALGPQGFSQSPVTRDGVQGSETIRGYRLSPDGRTVLDPSGHVFLRLPAMKRKAVPELMGMLQQGPDIELFLRRWDDPDPSGGTQFRLEIFLGRRGAEAAFVHDFTLSGSNHWVRFFQPPDHRDSPGGFIDENVGSITMLTYSLAPDRQSMQELYASTGYGSSEIIDLDGDGVYELVGWGRVSIPGCNFFHAGGPGGGPGSVPEIFVRAGPGYREAWPPPDWASATYGDKSTNPDWGKMFQADASLADLHGDGVVELIVLQERLVDNPAQVLAVYRLEDKSFRLVAQTTLPRERIAFRVAAGDSPGGKQILVRTVAPADCRVVGGEERGTAKVYILRGDELQEVQP